MSAGESLFPTLRRRREIGYQRICRRCRSWCMDHRVTLAVSAIAILAHVVPNLAAVLQLDFASAAAGQWWRLLSGHLTHYDSQHLFWDVLMFVVLGAACERQHPKLFGVSLLVMALGISATVALVCKDVSGYRGLSGIDTGLFVWFIGDQIRHCLAGRDRLFAGFWISMATLLVAKLLYEFVTGAVLFVDADGFKPLIESHLAGAVFGGLLVGIGWCLACRRFPSLQRSDSGG
ncbi:Rhomboid family protein [Stieleria maiorica]|uniref:Rhomboid family protein n=1 Tax=Stieleria maiorica TaxID=2795974 RepID=A0A5B9MH87_9BACT|nr:rhombosortase [Stieleria maiorica]QEG00264.1 Rhomboid family protein [Stieleria maiorica]